MSNGWQVHVFRRTLAVERLIGGKIDWSKQHNVSLDSISSSPSLLQSDKKQARSRKEKMGTLPCMAMYGCYVCMCEACRSIKPAFLSWPAEQACMHACVCICIYTCICGPKRNECEHAWK